MDHIIVPSTFTKNVVKRSGILKKKISVVPEWFNHNIIEQKENSESLDLSEIKTTKNYLMVAQLTGLEPDLDRKNIVRTLEWFLEYHKNDKDVGLILKTNFGRGTSKDYITTESYIKGIVNTQKHFRF